MSAWSEAVWVSGKIKAVKNTVDTINTTVNSIDTAVDTVQSDVQNQTYGLLALYNMLSDSDYGLAAIADLAVKKNVILTTNTGTDQAPQPANISNTDVVNGALFFIDT